jgi:hypothetical protein
MEATAAGLACPGLADPRLEFLLLGCRAALLVRAGLLGRLVCLARLTSCPGC